MSNYPSEPEFQQVRNPSFRPKCSFLFQPFVLTTFGYVGCRRDRSNSRACELLILCIRHGLYCNTDIFAIVPCQKP